MDIENIVLDLNGTIATDGRIPFEVNPVRNSSGALNPAGIILKSNPAAEQRGIISNGVKEKIKPLTEKVKIYVLTVDTQGTASEEIQDMKVELIKIAEEDSKRGKFDLLKTLTPESTVVIGNGNNDELILREAALGIAVLGDEGMSALAVKNADIIVKNISDALDLFLKPKRLIATLRE